MIWNAMKKARDWKSSLMLQEGTVCVRYGTAVKEFEMTIGYREFKKVTEE